MSNPLDDAVDQAFGDGDSTVTDSSVEETSQPQPPENSGKSESDTVEDKPQDEKVKPSAKDDKKSDPEESFTKVDTGNLPEELKPIYKSLQADYTRKRQADSQRAKDLEKEVERLRELVEGEPEESAEPVDPTSPDYVKSLARSVVQEEATTRWIAEAQAGLPEMDDRLNINHPDSDPFADDWIRSKLDEELDAYTDGGKGSPVGFDYRNRAKELLAEWDKYVNSLNKSYLDKQSKIAKEKAKASKKSKPATTSPASMKTSADTLEEAIETAFAES